MVIGSNLAALSSYFPRTSYTAADSWRGPTFSLILVCVKFNRRKVKGSCLESEPECVLQVVIVTLGKPVFDNSTNDLQYQVTFVPNMRHPSKTADFYKRHANATNSPKVSIAQHHCL